MKLQFYTPKISGGQAKAECDVFAGQLYFTPSYIMDRGIDKNSTVTGIIAGAKGCPG